MSDMSATTSAEHAAPQGDPIAVRRALNRSPIASALIRPDGYFVWVNAAMATLLGTDASMLVGRSTHAHTHDEDRPSHLEFLQSLLDSESIAGSFRSRFIPASGAVVFGDLTATRIESDDGSLDSFLVQIVDVTQEVQVELELRASRQRLLDTLDAELEGRVVLHALRDDDGRAVDMTYVEANRAACTALGLTRDQLIGRRLLEVFPEALSNGQLEVYIHVLETGIPMEWSGNPPSTTGMLGPDRYLDARIFKIDDGVSYAFRDVTDRVVAERRIAHSEAELRSMIESTRDAVIRTTTDGTITFVSPSIESILGWRPSDLVGRTAGEFIHPDDLPLLEESGEVLLAGRGVVRPARFRTKEGGYLWIEASQAPILGSESNVIGHIAVWRDVTERVALAESLEFERARLRAELDSELDPHITLTAVRDTSGKVTDFLYDNANQVALMYLGLTLDDLRSTSLMTMFPGVAATKLRDLYTQVIESGAPLVQDGFTYPNELFQFETRVYDLRGAKLGDGLSLSWRDVTDRENLHSRLAASEERFRLLAENSTDVVVLVQDDHIQWVSPSLEIALGWNAERWLQQSPAALVEYQDVTAVLGAIREAMSGSLERLRVRMRDSDGEGHWADMRIGPFAHESGVVQGAVATFRIVDSDVGAAAEHDRLITDDGLTRLVDRATVLARLDELLADDSDVAVIYGDIDHLDDINTAHGHAGGDEVLHIVAERTLSTLRSGDLAARIDGDEVLIVMSGIADESAADSAAERFRAIASGETALSSGEVVNVTMSVGVAHAGLGVTSQQLIERAESAMQEARRSGRDRVISA